MPLDKEEVKKWLRSIRKNRFWLAKQCNASKKTVDTWLSSDRGIPSKAILIIQNLMATSTSSTKEVKDSSLVIEFSKDEWKIVEEFQTLFPNANLEEYARGKIFDFCLGMNENKNSQTLRVADTNTSYDTESTKNGMRGKSATNSSKSGTYVQENQETDGTVIYRSESGANSTESGTNNQGHQEQDSPDIIVGLDYQQEKPA